MDYSCWYIKGDLSPLERISPEKTICFDTETTGFAWDGEDEILQIAIVRGDGKILFSDYIKPRLRKRWPKAQEVHGITYSMVKNKPTLPERLEELNSIFSQAELLVAYNMEFDLHFLIWNGVKIPDNVLKFDVMEEYAPVAGDYDDYHGDFRFKKLSHCARHYGYKFQAHDAVEDTKATLHCFYAMLKDEKPHSSRDKMMPYLEVVAIGRKSKEEKEPRKQKALLPPDPQTRVNPEAVIPDPNTRVTLPTVPPPVSSQMQTVPVPQPKMPQRAQQVNKPTLRETKTKRLLSRFFNK